MCHGDYYTSGYFPDYSYFEEHYKLIAIGLSNQALDVDPNAIQQFNITGNVVEYKDTTMFFIVKEGKEINLDFSQGTARVL